MPAGARRNDIPRQQRHDGRNEGDQIRRAKDQLPGGRALTHGAVHQALHFQVGEVQAPGDRGPDRRERVEALWTGVLVVAPLNVPRGHVVHTRDAQHVIVSTVGRHTIRAPADDDSRFGLVVHTPRARRQPDRIAGANHRRRRFQENERLDG
jgi:hypothetical protein